jgi:hypothetical protein
MQFHGAPSLPVAPEGSLAMAIPRPLGAARGARLIDLGGQAVHLFRFAAPVEVSYDYFLDIPAVFRLLPDALEVRAYARDRYRLIVGATDGHGHSMAAVFDLRAEYEPGRALRVLPAEDGPPVQLGGLVFSGALAAEAVFLPDGAGSSVEYVVTIEMSIPVPGVLRLMPQQMLQGIGEAAMEFKMTQMINGFTRNISADFAAWVRG